LFSFALISVYSRPNVSVVPSQPNPPALSIPIHIDTQHPPVRTNSNAHHATSPHLIPGRTLSSPDINQHRVPLNPLSPPAKRKRIRPTLSIKDNLRVAVSPLHNQIDGVNPQRPAALTVELAAPFPFEENPVAPAVIPPTAITVIPSSIVPSIAVVIPARFLSPVRSIPGIGTRRRIEASSAAFTAPRNVESVPFAAALRILNSHNHRTAVPRIAHQILPPASVNTLKTEIGRIARHRLVTHKAAPIRRAPRQRPQTSRVAHNLNFNDAVYLDLDRAFSIAATAANICAARCHLANLAEGRQGI
jgi:hypothetical protein